MTSALTRNRVTVSGTGPTTIMFGHGFGCSQDSWSQIAPHFQRDYRVVLFDLTGCGGSDRAAYEREKYSSLSGHAADVLEIIQALALTKVLYVGHSAGAMIGMLAAIRQPSLFRKLLVIGASPRYIDDEGYVGGSSRAQIEGVLASLESDYLAWCEAVVPAAMGNPDRPELGRALVRTFQRAQPDIAKHFGRAIFLSDHRSALPQLSTETLVVQAADDLFVPEAVGRYIGQQVAHGRTHQLVASGHYPQLSGPEELTRVLAEWAAA